MNHIIYNMYIFFSSSRLIYNQTLPTGLGLASWSQAGSLFELFRAVIMSHHVNPPSVLLGSEQSGSEASRLRRRAALPEHCNRRPVPTRHQQKPVSRLHISCQVSSSLTGCSCVKRCPLFLSGLSNHSVTARTWMSVHLCCSQAYIFMSAEFWLDFL